MHPKRSALLASAVLATAGVALASSAAGCGADSKDYFVVQYDAGSDAADAATADDGGVELDPTLGGPCTEDVQCDDLIPCTFDRCDKTISRCRNTPDDTQCSDGQYCNGQEKCVLRKGCVAGPVVTCDDKNFCTIDRCVEATRACERVIRDSDGDGDPDDHCESNRDCDDTDPTVSSLRTEICGNFKDDNCNGQIDEQPCATSAHDVCASALAVAGPGTFLLSTIAAVKDYTPSCSVQNPAAARDIVLEITVPAGGAQDVLVRTRANAPYNEVAVALTSACGSTAAEIACARTPYLNDARAIARSVPGGTKIWAIVTTQAESAVDVTVDFLPPTTKPTNESCTAPTPVTLETPFTVTLIDPEKDLASDCGAQTGEVTYSFTLTEPRDVRIFASTLAGAGSPVVSLRSATCTDELRCRLGSTPPVFARNLPAGTHVLAVSGTAQIDANILVRSFPATPAPPNQTCTTAPTLPLNTPITVDLSGNEDAIKNGCFTGGPTASYAFDITEPSDVLLLGRLPGGDYGALSMSQPTCLPPDLLGCSSGAPMRVSRRNVPPASYRAVIGDQKGLNAQLTALVRPTVPPTTVTTADGCADAQTIPATGGFFTGDTTNANADFGAGCDAIGQPIGGAKDQLLRLDLTQTRRVVFDMSGSSMTTLLVVRKGAACPGVEVTNACNPGLDSNRSFLDLTLDPGTYWIQIDGYSGSMGAWNLDVRVLPP